MAGKTLVLCNRYAGIGNSSDTRAALKKLTDATIREASGEQGIHSLAAQAKADGFDLVVAAGGDGTANQVANGLLEAGGDVTLGVLPLGTANDLCYTLGIPDDLEAAVDEIRRRRLRQIDVIEVVCSLGRTHCINVTTGGNSDRVTEMATPEMKQRWGPMCYLRGAISVLGDLESYEAEIAMDGRPPEKVRFWNLLVANGRTAGGRFEVAPRARLEDGLMDVVLIQDGSWVDLADVATRFLASNYLESEQVVYRQVRELSIQSDPSLRFSVDGDPVKDQLVAFRVLPRALRVVVGQAYEEAQPDHGTRAAALS